MSLRSCARCLRGSKIRDVTPGAYDSGHYCLSKLTVRYCSPCSTSSSLPDKFLLYTFRLQTFRFRPLHPRRILTRRTLLGITIAFRNGDTSTEFTIRSIDFARSISPEGIRFTISLYYANINFNNFTVFRERNVFALAGFCFDRKKWEAVKPISPHCFPLFFFDVLRVMLRTITLSAILITKFIFLYVFITALIED